MKQLNIPKKLHVGYQTRGGTYTGKLAYVIYTDEKGKMRKEKSWQSWRDDRLNPNDFTNEPTEGFVLNKNGGGKGYSSWDARNEFIRVWDPRDFEFEISLANLLFILEHNTSTKGKGLEGEFVYAWEGTSLILLPVDCAEYKSSTEFTGLKSMKVGLKERITGHQYENKDQKTLVYLGRHKCRKAVNFYQASDIGDIGDKKYHVFRDATEGTIHVEAGWTKIARKVGDNHPNYANMLQQFEDSEFMHYLDRVNLVPWSLTAFMDKKGHKHGAHTYYHSSGIYIEYAGEPDTVYRASLYSYGGHNRRGFGTRIGEPLSKDKVLKNKAGRESYHQRSAYRMTGAEAKALLANGAKFFVPEFVLTSGKILKGLGYEQ